MDKLKIDEWGNVIIQDEDSITFTKLEDYPEYVQREMMEKYYDY